MIYEKEVSIFKLDVRCLDRGVFECFAICYSRSNEENVEHVF